MSLDLAQILTPPKRVLLEEINSKGCIHDASFNLSDREYWNCNFGEECPGLLEHFQENNPDEVNNLSDRKQEKTIAVARITITNKIKLAQHDTTTCMCELCSWLREVNKSCG